METFSEAKALVDNPLYDTQRQQCLEGFDIRTIDAPIADVVSELNKLPYCFTLQSCYGHFVHSRRTSPNNTAQLPVLATTERIQYRIAYIALCVENSKAGRAFLSALKQITAIDPNCIQFGSARWFWERQINSYALQIEPIRHMNKDCARVDYKEALYIEAVRNKFFAGLKDLLQRSGK